MTEEMIQSKQVLDENIPQAENKEAPCKKGFFKKIFRTQEGLIWKAVAFPILLIWSLSLIYPFVWAFINSFKTPAEYLKNSFSLPEVWRFSNWVTAFTALEVPLTNPIETANMFDMIFNSIWWMAGTVIFSNCVTIGMAYALAKYKYKIGKFLYTMNLVIMTIPIVGAFPAQYSLYKSLGIMNTPFMLLTSLGCLGSANLMLYYSYFKNISWTYAEAVFVDGGGHWTVFLRVMIPQAMPIISALVILACIASWNDYFTALVYLTDFPTLATGLYRMSVSSTLARNMPVYFAAVLWSVLPMIVLFAVFSDKIMTSVSIGGIKG